MPESGIGQRHDDDNEPTRRRSGLLTTLTALLSVRGVSGKAIAYRLKTQHANVFLHLGGTGDQVIQGWESSLNAMRGKLFLDPLPDSPATEKTIQIPLTPINEERVERQRTYLKRFAPARYVEWAEWSTFGVELELPSEEATIKRLGQATALLSNRRQLDVEHLMILSGVWRQAANRISFGIDKPVIAFHQQCSDICGYQMRIVSDGLCIRVARPVLPSIKASEAFKREHLKREREYQSAAKVEKRTAGSTGNRGSMSTEELCEALRTSDEWSKVADKAGVTRQAIAAFAKRHGIPSPRARLQKTVRAQAVRRIGRLTVPDEAQPQSLPQ